MFKQDYNYKPEDFTIEKFKRAIQALFWDKHKKRYAQENTTEERNISTEEESTKEGEQEEDREE